MNAATFALIGLGVTIGGLLLVRRPVRSMDSDGPVAILGGIVAVFGVLIMIAALLYAMVRDALT